jgi:CBS domain containing-hemolysin-like protein
MAVELLFAIFLVLANAFFVAAEFGIARLRPTQVADLVAQGRPGARSAQHAVEHIDSYLSACQLGITLASLGLGAVGESAFHDLLEPVVGDNARIVGFGLASAIAFSIITVLHVVVGELAPKSAAIARTVPVALALAPLMRGFYMAAKPLVDLSTRWATSCSSRSGSRPPPRPAMRRTARTSCGRSCARAARAG